MSHSAYRVDLRYQLRDRYEGIRMVVRAPNPEAAEQLARMIAQRTKGRPAADWKLVGCDVLYAYTGPALAFREDTARALARSTRHARVAPVSRA